MSFTKHDQNFIRRLLQICESENLKPQSKDYLWLMQYKYKLESLPDWKKELLLSSGLYEKIESQGKANLKKSAKKARIIAKNKRDSKPSDALPNKKSERNTTGYTGVCWEESHSKWRAQIGFKGHNYFLGRYDRVIDAVNVRKEAEKHLDKDFLSWYKDRKQKG